MNPIYRHSFVNALLANGAFASTTGMIDGNNNNYFYIPEKYIKVIVPIQEAYFMIVIKNILEGGEAIRREQ